PLGMVLAFTPMVAMGSEAVRNVVQYLFPVQIFVTLFDMLMPEYTAVLTRVNIEGYDIMHRFVGEYVLEPIEPLSQGMTTSLIIIGANAVVFAILFAIAYKRKGLKG
ncbi:MAG: hypothetical protein FWB74_04970, partial [Defluviitaleaceae bacterium]|nr:hypothetical protein [Defluviitaleaceae bacterium]